MSSTATAEAEYNIPLIVGSLILGVFFGGVGGGVAFPTLPILGTVLGISPFVVGVILSMNRFTRLLMNTPAGQIIDRFGTRTPMIVGFVLQGLAPFGYVLGLYAEFVPILGPAAVFIVARVVWGFGSAFVFVGAFSTVTHITTQNNRGKWIGYFRGGQSLGFPTGLILGGLLTEMYGYAAAFAISGAIGLFAALVAFFVLPNIYSSIDRRAKIRELPHIVQRDRRIFAIGTVNFTVRFLFAGVLLSTVVLYLDAQGVNMGGFSAVGTSGFVMAIAVIFSSGTTLVSGVISDNVGDRVLVTLPALGCLGFGFVLLGMVPTLPGIIAGIAAVGIGVGGTNPPLLAYLGDISPEGDVGKIGGVYNVFGDLGSMLGPMVALPLAARIGYRTEYLLCAGLVAGIGVFVLRTLLGSATRRPCAGETK